MSFKEYLKNYQRQVEGVIEEFFDSQIKKVSPLSSLAVQQLKDYRGYLKGGKKLRGAEVVLGYQIYGGKNKTEIMRASVVVELIHAALLMQDDVMDQEVLRRGKSTIHKKYSEKFGNRYGESMAINMADAGFFLGFKLLNELNFPSVRLSGASGYLSDLLTEVVLGQVMDLTFQHERRFNESDVLSIHRFKTADYTISGPLSLGAILAGAGVNDLDRIKHFGLPVGIAFQIKDDELGVFGSAEELGKSVGSDLKEGKATILVAASLEKAKPDDKKFILDVLGKDLSWQEVERVRAIMIECGALAYSQALAQSLVDQGKAMIGKLTSDKTYQRMLAQLSDLVIQRGK